MRRRSKDHWVTEYYLQYSDDDVTWIDYLENGHVKVSGNHFLSGLKVCSYRENDYWEALCINWTPGGVVPTRVLCGAIEVFSGRVRYSHNASLSPRMQKRIGK